MLPTSLRSSIQGSTYYGRDALSHEEEYAFQVAGYLNVRHIHSAQQRLHPCSIASSCS